jgi:hypothetical protein
MVKNNVLTSELYCPKGSILVKLGAQLRNAGTLAAMLVYDVNNLGTTYPTDQSKHLLAIENALAPIIGRKVSRKSNQAVRREQMLVRLFSCLRDWETSADDPCAVATYTGAFLTIMQNEVASALVCLGDDDMVRAMVTLPMELVVDPVTLTARLLFDVPGRSAERLFGHPVPGSRLLPWSVSVCHYLVSEITALTHPTKETVSSMTELTPALERWLNYAEVRDVERWSPCLTPLAYAHAAHDDVFYAQPAELFPFGCTTRCFVRRQHPWAVANDCAPPLLNVMEIGNGEGYRVTGVPEIGQSCAVIACPLLATEDVLGLAIEKRNTRLMLCTFHAEQKEDPATFREPIFVPGPDAERAVAVLLPRRDLETLTFAPCIFCGWMLLGSTTQDPAEARCSFHREDSLDEFLACCAAQQTLPPSWWEPMSPAIKASLVDIGLCSGDAHRAHRDIGSPADAIRFGKERLQAHFARLGVLRYAPPTIELDVELLHLRSRRDNLALPGPPPTLDEYAVTVRDDPRGEVLLGLHATFLHLCMGKEISPLADPETLQRQEGIEWELRQNPWIAMALVHGGAKINPLQPYPSLSDEGRTRQASSLILHAMGLGRAPFEAQSPLLTAIETEDAPVATPDSRAHRLPPVSRYWVSATVKLADGTQTPLWLPTAVFFPALADVAARVVHQTAKVSATTLFTELEDAEGAFSSSLMRDPASAIAPTLIMLLRTVHVERIMRRLPLARIEAYRASVTRVTACVPIVRRLMRCLLDGAGIPRIHGVEQCALHLLQLVELYRGLISELEKQEEDPEAPTELISRENLEEFVARCEVHQTDEAERERLKEIPLTARLLASICEDPTERKVSTSEVSQAMDQIEAYVREGSEATNLLRVLHPRPPHLAKDACARAHRDLQALELLLVDCMVCMLLDARPESLATALTHMEWCKRLVARMSSASTEYPDSLELLVGQVVAEAPVSLFERLDLPERLKRISSMATAEIRLPAIGPLVAGAPCVGLDAWQRRRVAFREQYSPAVHAQYISLLFWSTSLHGLQCSPYVSPNVYPNVGVSADGPDNGIRSLPLLLAPFCMPDTLGAAVGQAPAATAAHALVPSRSDVSNMPGGTGLDLVSLSFDENMPPDEQHQLLDFFTRSSRQLLLSKNIDPRLFCSARGWDGMVCVAQAALALRMLCSSTDAAFKRMLLVSAKINHSCEVRAIDAVDMQALDTHMQHGLTGIRARTMPSMFCSIEIMRQWLATPTGQSVITSIRTRTPLLASLVHVPTGPEAATPAPPMPTPHSLVALGDVLRHWGATGWGQGLPLVSTAKVEEVEPGMAALLIGCAVRQSSTTKDNMVVCCTAEAIPLLTRLSSARKDRVRSVEHFIGENPITSRSAVRELRKLSREVSPVTDLLLDGYAHVVHKGKIVRLKASSAAARQLARVGLVAFRKKRQRPDFLAEGVIDADLYRLSLLETAFLLLRPLNGAFCSTQRDAIIRLRNVLRRRVGCRCASGVPCPGLDNERLAIIEEKNTAEESTQPIELAFVISSHSMSDLMATVCVIKLENARLDQEAKDKIHVSKRQKHLRLVLALKGLMGEAEIEVLLAKGRQSGIALMLKAFEKQGITLGEFESKAEELRFCRRFVKCTRDSLVA